MGNVCSQDVNVPTTVNGKCYVMNGKDSCDVGGLQMQNMQNISSFVCCILSAILVFFIMDRKRLFSKVALGCTILSAVMALVAYFLNRKAISDKVAGKPRC